MINQHDKHNAGCLYNRTLSSRSVTDVFTMGAPLGKDPETLILLNLLDMKIKQSKCCPTRQRYTSNTILGTQIFNLMV